MLTDGEFMYTWSDQSKEGTLFTIPTETEMVQQPEDPSKVAPDFAIQIPNKNMKIWAIRSIRAEKNLDDSPLLLKRCQVYRPESNDGRRQAISATDEGCIKFWWYGTDTGTDPANDETFGDQQQKYCLISGYTSWVTPAQISSTFACFL